MLINKKALTLIELLAVIAIIAILFILLIPNISSAVEKARIAGLQTDLRSYQIAGQSFFLKGDTSLEQFNSYLDEDLKIVNGLSKEKDPWGNPYEVNLSGGEIVISSSTEEHSYSLGMKEENGAFVYEVNGLDNLVGKNNTSNNPGGDSSNETNPGDTNNQNEEDDNIQETYLTYSDNGDGTVNITGYTGTEPNLIIPSVLDGKTVVGFADMSLCPVTVFGECGNKNVVLTSVVLPDTIKHIGAYAFYWNAITTINVPNGVETIMASSLARNAITELHLPSGIKNLGAYSLEGNGLTSITLPSDLESIGNNALSSNKLTSVQLPNTLKTISSYAFSSNQLTHIDIPSSVTVIGSDAFYNNLLTTVNLSEGIVDIQSNAFEKNALTSINIPSTLKTIGEEAFLYNNISTLLVPSTVESIGDYAFWNQVTTVTNKSSIPNSAFDLIVGGGVTVVN